MTKYKEGTLPIEWTDWYKDDESEYTFNNVEFTEDFGDIMKGQTFESVGVDYNKGILEAYPVNMTDNIQTVHFKCVPITSDKQIIDKTIERCINIVKSHIRENCDNHTPYQGACSDCGSCSNPDLIKYPDELVEELENLKNTINNNGKI